VKWYSISSSLHSLPLPTVNVSNGIVLGGLLYFDTVSRFCFQVVFKKCSIWLQSFCWSLAWESKLQSTLIFTWGSKITSASEVRDRFTWKARESRPALNDSSSDTILKTALLFETNEYQKNATMRLFTQSTFST
jgi:hypothetical protein